MSKDERIRILFAEDLHTDVDLARRKISRVFPEIEVSVVDTEQDFVEKLEAFRPDLVISDYMMPTFDGMRVIELVLEKAPENILAVEIADPREFGGDGDIVPGGFSGDDLAAQGQMHEGRCGRLCNKGTYGQTTIRGRRGNGEKGDQAGQGKGRKGFGRK